MPGRAASAEPRYKTSYPLNVANVVLALFPGLINSSAIAILAPMIGGEFGVPAQRVGELPLLNDAGLAFGCLLAAEMARRIPGRTLFYWLMSLSLIVSLVSALAPNFDVLLVAHVVHGLLGGMLFVVMLPPLLTTFGSAKIKATATVLVPSLFGAATLGPVVGGLVANGQMWRAIFAVEVVMSLAALVLGRLTLAERKPPPTDDPVDVPCLALAALGSTGIYIGVGNLATHDLSYVPASLPLGGGIVAFIGMFLYEALAKRPLVPVRRMFTSIAIIGAVASVFGSACFVATQQCIVLGLARIDGLDARATGFALWPEFIAALIAGFVFGRAVGTRWLVVLGTFGLVLTGIAAAIVMGASPVDASSAPWVAMLAGLGAGLAVTPGIFIVALSFERALVARAIALLNLLRLTGGFISSPGVEHTIGSSTSSRLAELAPNVPIAHGAVRTFITTGAPGGLPIQALHRALDGALHEALAIVIGLAALGVVINTTIIIAAHVPIRRPNLTAIDEGKAALSAPV